jgi:aspartate ammonia-lyase
MGESSELIMAYVKVKKAAAITNMELNFLDKEIGEAILKASDDILMGDYLDQFPIDIFQAGAGTSFNMNQ